MERKASAEWKGALKDGRGTISAASGALSGVPYTFPTRFENAPGTNPEELVAAAHAACFSMALAGQLANEGVPPDSIATTATVTLEKLADGWTVTKSHLDVTAKVPGTDKAVFDTAAQKAKSGCPISRLLNATITMSCKLES
jgi:lipoyl-dependent peroxiredoxin